MRLSHLYKRVCPSVRPAVCRSIRPLVRRSVTTLLKIEKSIEKKQKYHKTNWCKYCKSIEHSPHQSYHKKIERYRKENGKWIEENEKRVERGWKEWKWKKKVKAGGNVRKKTYVAKEWQTSKQKKPGKQEAWYVKRLICGNWDNKGILYKDVSVCKGMRPSVIESLCLSDLCWLAGNASDLKRLVWYLDGVAIILHLHIDQASNLKAPPFLKKKKLLFPSRARLSSLYLI